jgi:hypothetical protein
MMDAMANAMRALGGFRDRIGSGGHRLQTSLVARTCVLDTDKRRASEGPGEYGEGGDLLYGEVS